MASSVFAEHNNVIVELIFNLCPPKSNQFMLIISYSLSSQADTSAQDKTSKSPLNTSCQEQN